MENGSTNKNGNDLNDKHNIHKGHSKYHTTPRAHHAQKPKHIKIIAIILVLAMGIPLILMAFSKG